MQRESIRELPPRELLLPSEPKRQAKPPRRSTIVVVSHKAGSPYAKVLIGQFAADAVLAGHAEAWRWPRKAR
jgi:hypothetical protein